MSGRRRGGHIITCSSSRSPVGCCAPERLISSNEMIPSHYYVYCGHMLSTIIAAKTSCFNLVKGSSQASHQPSADVMSSTCTAHRTSCIDCIFDTICNTVAVSSVTLRPSSKHRLSRVPLGLVVIVRGSRANQNVIITRASVAPAAFPFSPLHLSTFPHPFPSLTHARPLRIPAVPFPANTTACLSLS